MHLLKSNPEQDTLVICRIPARSPENWLKQLPSVNMINSPDINSATTFGLSTSPKTNKSALYDCVSYIIHYLCRNTVCGYLTFTLLCGPSFSKLLSWSKKHIIAHDIFGCCSITISICFNYEAQTCLSMTMIQWTNLDKNMVGVWGLAWTEPWPQSH